ncbi:MAG: hypothetical protein CMD07_06005 [Flavobacteriales bacterium]|nr:hypothetical protein [Flavobacteriales bacterium]
MNYFKLNKLIFINCIIFILIKIIDTISFLSNIDFNYIKYCLGLSSSFNYFTYDLISLFTYMFVHFDFIHFALNMMSFYFISNIFLIFFEKYKLFVIYLFGGITGGIFYVFSHNYFPVFENQNGLLIGSSASIIAILSYLTLIKPNYEINFVNFSFKLKFVTLFIFLIDIISIPNGNPGGHISHIGGLFSGILFSLFELNNKIFKTKISHTIKSRNNKISKRFKTNIEYNSEKIELNNKIDKILEKISTSGYDSLSKFEKDFLNKNSNNL